MSTPRILVVEDDEHARGLLVAVLRADGHTVDAAATRAEAESLIDQHAYALVLSALRMPRLDGPELARVLEQRRPLEMPALIFLARIVFAPDLAHFLMESAARLLGWPATPADISRIVALSLVPTPA
ncbi:MAG: response regulator [Candidatus Rokuibacteriota bacterium]